MYDSDDRGAVNDAVCLRLNGETIIPISYDIQIGVMESPASFSLRLGSGDICAQLMQAVPPNTPFELLIGDVPQFTGNTDGYEASSGEGATTLNIVGRDDLAPLQDGYVQADTTFTETTLKELVVKVLELAGIKGYSLVYDNEANRRKVVGAAGSGSGAMKQIKKPWAPPKFLGWSPAGHGPFLDHVGKAPEKPQTPAKKAKLTPGTATAQAAMVAAIAAANGPAIGMVTGLAMGMAGQAGDKPDKDKDDADKSSKPEGRKVQAKVGQRWFEFLRSELDRAGLFLWSGPDRVFILSTPNRNQPAAFEIVRRRGQTRNEVNVISARARNITTARHTHAICFCHSGGKKHGRIVSTGFATDDEMLAYGFARPFSIKDGKGKSLKQAEYLARKCLAEGRRAGWALTYTVSGHTTPLAKSGQRAVWAVDTMVHVKDDEFGIDANLYVSNVVHHRGPETTTELTLQRAEDLITAEEPE